MKVIIPLKSFDNAKQRLASILSAKQRRHFFRAMVEDVLAIVSTHAGIDGMVLLSDEASAAALAEEYGAGYLSEKQLQVKGLNESLQAAVMHLSQRGVSDVMIVHGDLPMLTHQELDALLDRYHQATGPAMAIAADRSGTGTNILLFPTNLTPHFAYGPSSCRKHQQEADRLGMTFISLNLPGAGCDIDLPEDLQKLRASWPAATNKSTRYLHHEFPTSTHRLSDQQALSLVNEPDTLSLMKQAREMRDREFRNLISYSRKIFIPLTQLCRDVCHYCTFAQTPKNIDSPYLSVEAVLETVRQGQVAGCKEVLFTLGERPELRYHAAREALAELGFDSTLAYLAHVAGRVLEETGLLPHINAGCMTSDEMAMLRPVSASMGIMLESAAERLCQKGMPHYGSPDKDPAKRLETLRLAGELKVPFTSGILIGIGETRRERIESLLALRQLHEEYGQLQEVIIQNFRAKPGTKMAEAPEPDLEELLWTIAVARLIFGPAMSIQAPPNLSPGVLPQLINAGLNDWGGVSPVTPDFVNPEAPWPHLEKLALETALTGKQLQERLTIYPEYVLNSEQWLDPALQTGVLQMIDTEGFPRTDDWSPGETVAPPKPELDALGLPIKNIEMAISHQLRAIVDKVQSGQVLAEAEIIRLFQARGPEFAYVCQQANRLREQVNEDAVSYVVNRNINYTNICYFKCQFCAFSKGKTSEELRGKPYILTLNEIANRASEAWARGATEVCMQGGIHPDYTGQTYLDILAAIKTAAPDIHIHAFSPLEVWQGAQTLGVSLEAFLLQLKDAGLKSLPGTAAEILDDEIRAQICPDKICTEQWLEVMETAHKVGLRSTATIMFGHVDRLEHWARHLLRVRALQERTGGFTEFVPLPFVHRESPMYLRGKARKGPTFRESMLMHAVARLVLHGQIDNIQVSWVKLGEQGVLAGLAAGANDMGGTLMNESISSAAGASHGQEMTADQFANLLDAQQRKLYQRTTLYKPLSMPLSQPVRFVTGKL